MIEALDLFLALLWGYGGVGVVLLAVTIGGANGRRRRDPVKALGGTLPPEHEAKYEYAPSTVLLMSFLMTVFLWVFGLLSPYLFPGSGPLPAWMTYGCPALAVVLGLWYVIGGRGAMVFDEEKLDVAKCGILYEGDRQVAWKQSFNLAWSEMESVDYSRNDLVLITTTDGRRFGVRPFLFAGSSMRGCNTVEMGMRIDYYARYFGHGEHDMERMEEKYVYPIEVTYPVIYSVVGVVLVIIVDIIL